MAKFYGVIGFVRTYEVMIDDEPTGKFRTENVERYYRGEIIRNSRRWSESTEKVNEDIRIDNQFSILADSFAIENFTYMKYIECFGVRWLITNVEIQERRLILSTGGVYNG